mgnify:CR=1 FL=1
MHRIDHSTNNASLPAPDAAGTPGYFKKGDPGLGIPATVVTQDWANAMQEELAYVILQAGLVLSKTDNTQLRQAIQNMIQSANSAVIITGATFEASVSNGEAVQWDSTNSRFDEAIADGTANNRAVGIADVTNGKVYCYGETPALFAGLTPGGRYYLSAATAGAITTTPPSDQVLVGLAKSATVLFVDIDPLVGVNFASTAETRTGTETAKAVTPAGMKGAIGFSNFFESAEQNIVTNTDTGGIAHGLGSTPKFFAALIRCKTAEYGYAVGDEVMLVTSNTSIEGLGGYVNAANVGFVISVDVRIIDRATPGTVRIITMANWKVVLRAWA